MNRPAPNPVKIYTSMTKKNGLRTNALSLSPVIIVRAGVGMRWVGPLAGALFSSPTPTCCSISVGAGVAWALGGDACVARSSASMKSRLHSVGAGVAWALGGDACVARILGARTIVELLERGRRKRPHHPTQPPPPLRNCDESG